jgi:sigma-B regulation protein RsbU (phosphoserine phosphatase)
MDFARGRLGGGVTLTRDAAAPIEPLLRHVVAELQVGAPDQVIEASFELTDRVNCDPRRVGQILSNLLGNALTHGASDKPIQVAAVTTGGWFELSVTNGGDPIPPAALKNIFQPFTRGTLGTSQQGLGLGLYIAHQIAVAHGGRLDVVSARAGTRFTFRMPLQS